MRPEVSVIVPAYNHEQYIGAAIESVLSQTYEDFELLISDDCSTDGTRSIISGYTDPRIRTFFFDKNGGTVNALNTLLDLAKGEYIAVLGSDDIWAPDKLSKQIEVMRNMPDIAACFTYAEIIDSDSKTVESSDTFPLEIFNYPDSDRCKILFDFFISGNHFCHSSAFIRTSVHKETGYYNPQYRQLHDFDLWLRILIKYPVRIIDEKLVKYRIAGNGENLSRNTNENNLRMFNEAKYIFANMFEQITDDDFKSAFGKLFIKKNVEKHGQLRCEKFFLLWNEYLWEQNVKSLAIDYLMKNISDPEFKNCLETEYGFGRNDFYGATGSFSADSPVRYNDDYIAMSEDLASLRSENASMKQKLQEVYNSRIWKFGCRIRKLKNFGGNRV